MDDDPDELPPKAAALLAWVQTWASHPKPWEPEEAAVSCYLAGLKTGIALALVDADWARDAYMQLSETLTAGPETPSPAEARAADFAIVQEILGKHGAG